MPKRVITIDLQPEQRLLLLRISSAYVKSLSDDFASQDVMICHYWHTYLEKLWLEAEHKAGNKQINIPGHRRQSLREIKKIQGHWPDADEIIQQLLKFGLNDELASALCHDIEQLKD
jgi:hypothetical protein